MADEYSVRDRIEGKVPVWWECPKCAIIIANFEKTVAAHKESKCGKIKLDKKNRLPIAKSFHKNAKINVFYDKGMVHCMTTPVFAKYCGTTIGKMKNRILQFTIKELLDPKTDYSEMRSGGGRDRGVSKQISPRAKTVQDAMRNW